MQKTNLTPEQRILALLSHAEAMQTSIKSEIAKSKNAESLITNALANVQKTLETQAKKEIELEKNNLKNKFEQTHNHFKKFLLPLYLVFCLVLLLTYFTFSYTLGEKKEELAKAEKSLEIYKSEAEFFNLAKCPDAAGTLHTCIRVDPRLTFDDDFMIVDKR